MASPKSPSSTPQATKSSCGLRTQGPNWMNPKLAQLVKLSRANYIQNNNIINTKSALTLILIQNTIRENANRYEQHRIQPNNEFIHPKIKMLS